MPHRRPKPSLVLGAVAALAVASPFAAMTLSGTDVRSTNDQADAVPTNIAEVALASVPDITVPLKELTGLNLPDLRLSDLKKIHLPADLQLPAGLSIPPAIAALLDPAAATVPADPSTPVSPDQVPQELTDAVGTTVKEIDRDTPFSMIALTAADLAHADAKVRVKQPDGSWGQWWSTEQIEHRPGEIGVRPGDPAPAKTGTEPVYVGNTNAVQVLVTKKAPAAPAPATPAPAPAVAPASPAPDAPPLGYRPASNSTPLHAEPASDEAATDEAASDLSVALIEPGEDAADATLSDIATPVAGGGPKVISRSQWGADESIRCSDPTYDDFIGGATVHHSAGSNDYTKAQSAGIVRSIYAYHAKTLGWCDIGYNALVDKYGQVFEGRSGGIDKPVEGAHAGGFNENTVGVAMLGNFEKQAPTQATIDAVGNFLGWRLKKANLDPKGHTTMYSEGTSFTRYPEGQAVDLPVIFAHRDVGDTACPGDAAYAKMDEIRDIAASYGGPKPETQASAPATPDKPDTLASDLGRLAGQLLQLTDPSPVAKKWAETGGDTGPLGAAESGLLPAADGQQYAKFANGYIVTAAGGGPLVILGKVLDRFKALGLDVGNLGSPLSAEYLVPEGMRADYQKGSLIFDQITGFVKTVLDTYNNAYDEAYQAPHDVSTPAPAPPVPAATPAPEAPAPEALVPVPS